MHIENMHCVVEKLAECTKNYLDQGVEQADLGQVKCACEALEGINAAIYYATVTKAMGAGEKVEYDPVTHPTAMTADMHHQP